MEGWVEILGGDHSIPVPGPIKNRRLLGVLLGLGLVVRLGYSLHLPDELLLPDAVSFDSIAWTLASEGRYEMAGRPTAYRPPAYVLFLAAIYKAAGHRYRAVRAAQAFLGIGLVLVLIKTAEELQWNERVQWAAGILAAFYPFFIYYESHLIADAYLAFWHAAALLFYLRWIQRPASAGRAGLMGFAYAVLCLIKSIFCPIFVLVMSVETWKSGRRKGYWRGFWAAILAFLLPVSFWAARNERVFGRLLLDGHGGRTAVETVVFHDYVKNGTFMPMWLKNPLNTETQTMDESQRDAYYVAYTKQFVRDHPALYAKQSLERFKDLWRFYPRQDIQFIEGGRTLTFLSLMTEPFLIFAGFFGLWKARGRWRELYPFYATILFTTIAHTLITGQMRYRLPLMPVLILFASYAVFAPKNRPSDH